MWNSVRIDIKALACLVDEKLEKLPEALAAWNVTNLIVREDNPKDDSFNDVYLQSNLTTIRIDNISSSNCFLMPNSSTEDLKKFTKKRPFEIIEPVIAPKYYEPVDAAGAEVVGATGFLIISIILAIIVISDIRYFKIVLPMFRQNFMTGVYRIKRTVYRGSIIGSMHQFIVLTSRMGGEGPVSNSTFKKVSTHTFIESKDVEPVSNQELDMSATDVSSSV